MCTFAGRAYSDPWILRFRFNLLIWNYGKMRWEPWRRDWHAHALYLSHCTNNNANGIRIIRYIGIAIGTVTATGTKVYFLCSCNRSFDTVAIFNSRSFAIRFFFLFVSFILNFYCCCCCYSKNHPNTRNWWRKVYCLVRSLYLISQIIYYYLTRYSLAEKNK